MVVNKGLDCGKISGIMEIPTILVGITTDYRFLLIY